MIAYQRTQRFGYKEVLSAFEGLLNSACEEADLSYKFSLSQYTEGINLDYLRKELEQNPIQKLNIKYQIPNPDSNLLDEIRFNKEKTIALFEEANLTTKSVIYQSNSNNGINLESEMIKKELENISSLHSKIDIEDALKNGYVVVESTGMNGLMRSSADMRPLIRHIDDICEFKKLAESTICSCIANEIREDQ